MIVLRIRLDGVMLDHRLERGDATLGSGSRSTIRATNAGWPPLAATLRQAGTEVHMTVPGRVGTVTLRLGEEIRLGRADVSVEGLLPLEDEALPSAEAGASCAAPSAAASSPPPALPLFGDYAETSAPRFALDEPPRARACDDILPSPSHPSAPVTAASPTTTPATGEVQAAASAWAGPQQDFGAELYAQIKRTPWFAISIAAHVLLFLLFRQMVSHATQPAMPWGGGTLEGSLLPQVSDAQENARDAEALEAPEPLPMSEAVPEPDVLFDEPTAPNQAPEPFPSVRQADEEPPSDLGTLPTLSAAGRRTAPRSVPSPATAPRDDLREVFVKGTMHDARKRAAKHVLDALGVDRGGPGAVLKKLTAPEVLVVEGEWDHQERVLSELGIAHTTLSPYDATLASGSAFDQPRFVFWNCGDHMNPRQGARLGPRVRAFVERGGYLFTSDWALDNIVKPAFPGYVDSRGASAPLPEVVLDIAPTRAGAGHPLLDGVFQPGLVGRWWLEAASHDIVIKKPSEVTVLIESPQLRDLMSRSPVMAFTFTHGKGRVLHVLGHYDQKEGNIAGTVAVQRIALNFVLMGMGAAQAK